MSTKPLNTVQDKKLFNTLKICYVLLQINQSHRNEPKTIVHQIQNRNI
jgi:hypothetical protein